MDKYHNWNIGSVWCRFFHIKCIYVNDLHLMGQWFHLTCISWRLFDGGMLYWKYWFSATLSLTYKYICKSKTYISWYSDSALYLQYYLMNKPHSLNIGSVWYGPLTCISWFSNFESFTYTTGIKLSTFWNFDTIILCTKSSKLILFLQNKGEFRPYNLMQLFIKYTNPTFN